MTVFGSAAPDAVKMAPRWEVCREVLMERVRQDEKWGPQNHPDGTGPLYDVMDSELIGANDNQDLAMLATIRCNNAHGVGVGTWEHILTEEWAEALAEEDPAKLRVELIQVAAVCAAWVEAIDRR